MLRKRPSHLVCFYSNNNKPQIDVVLVHTLEQKLVTRYRLEEEEADVVSCIQLPPFTAVEETLQSATQVIVEPPRIKHVTSEPAQRKTTSGCSSALMKCTQRSAKRNAYTLSSLMTGRPTSATSPATRDKSRNYPVQ